ncbi:sulfur-oxidizing protein SoxY [Noviherbaspirillum humi]|uniref:Sulfur-oxidizing protein SoxY n=1 Tax=Noviherbaspirillum humi TaxID=1688639 RepID=A0A239FIC3_9BURK|nr:SoxY-related AACIE arm protein [Noviherbaspirillum humi]SNS55804.1 sulfur-oxidizing protein SoxY [Noviherbaspirillum humi]
MKTIEPTINDDDPADCARRRVLAGGAALVLSIVVRPAAAAPDDLAGAIAAYTNGAQVKKGRVKLEVAELVDNGNAVPLAVSIDSPMSAADHVAAIAIFNEKNPQRDVARFILGPRAGRAQVSTRIRLATTQKLVAVAKMSDGSYWSDTVDVIVTLAACIEETT